MKRTSASNVNLPQLVIGTDTDHIILEPASPPDSEGWMDVTIYLAVGAWKGRIRTYFQTRDWLQFRNDLPALYSPSTRIQLSPIEPEFRLGMQSDKLGHIDVTGVAWDHMAEGNKLEFDLPQLDQTFVRMWLEQIDTVIRWMGSSTALAEGGMSREQFIGAWKLVSAEYRRADGTTLEYLGENPIGMIVYTADGHISVHLMRRDRPRFATDDRLGGTPEQIRAAFQGYMGYFGTYTLDEEKGTVTHHLEGCSFPNWIGGDQKRFFDLSGDRLTLRTSPLLIHGENVTGYLVWQRTGEGR